MWMSVYPTHVSMEDPALMVLMYTHVCVSLAGQAQTVKAVSC